MEVPGIFGDIISSLPAVRALGGGHYAIGHRPGPYHGRESMEGARFEAIKPLLLEQPYIRGVKWIGEDFSGVNYDFSKWRFNWRRDENLAQAHARHIGVEISEDPWLTATPNEQYRGVTVMARSLRYHDGAFPWAKMIRENPEAIFVGLPEEHLVFQRSFGKVDYVPTETLLDTAEIMAASNLVIANQTCAWWIAIGLGVDVLQETYSLNRDSIIRRPSARYFCKLESKQPAHHK